MPSCLMCPVRSPFVPFFLFRVKENRLVGFFACLFHFFQWEDFHQQQQVGLGSVHRLLLMSARGQCTRAPAQIGAFFSLACAFVPHSFKSKEAPSVRDRDGALAWLAAGELSLDKRLLLVPFRTEYIAGTPGSLWGMGKEDQIELEPERKKKYC
ncbi:hypothetical protein V6N11_034317 [Hibiscus sabdariffa]|uniref:Uncharacterized protein n=1 Tax=Hibiscus sabdariffa TaxID=183260 RepID=A0ABR1ZYH0_9ROSI